MKCFVVLAALAAVSVNAAVVKRAIQLPEYFPTACSRNAAPGDLNECIRKNIQNVIPLFGKGEKLFKLGPLDPMVMNDNRVSLKRDPFDFEAVARNTKVTGIKDVIVRGVRARLSDDRMDMEIDVTFPYMLLEGDFKMDGKLANIPYSGKGPYNVSFTDIVATWHLIGEAYEKNGEKYMQINRFIPDYTVTSMRSWADNLVQGSPELTSLAMNLINQFWQPVLRAMMPITNVEIERVLRRMANNVFTVVPYDQLFPVA